MNSAEINIIQFGTGNFLRAFIAPVFQDLKDRKLANPAICIVESTGSGTTASLAEEQFRYPVWTTGIQNGKEVNEEVAIDCIQSGISLPEDHHVLMNLATNPSLEWILSNVTEAGFVLQNEEPLPSFPASFPARLTYLLLTRYQEFQGDTNRGLQILPCELIESNGKKLREMVIRQAGLWQVGAGFLQWLDTSTTFYNSLVDRIVPGKPSTESLARHAPKLSEHPFRVQAEPYFLLALSGKPKQALTLDPFVSNLNVVQVDTVRPFAERKVKILNGAHIAMVALGLPKGIQTVSEFMKNEGLFTELEAMIREEVIPFISQDPEQLREYAQEIWDRFRNPFIVHQLQAISLNSIAKLTPRIIESMESYYKDRGQVPKRLSSVLIAILLRYLQYPELIRDTAEVQEIFAQARRKISASEKAEFILAHPKLWSRNLLEFKGLKAMLVDQLP